MAQPVFRLTLDWLDSSQTFLATPIILVVLANFALGNYTLRVKKISLWLADVTELSWIISNTVIRENGSIYTTMTHWLPSHAILKNKAILHCNCAIKAIENKFNPFLFSQFTKDRIEEWLLCNSYVVICKIHWFTFFFLPLTLNCTWGVCSMLLLALQM